MYYNDPHENQNPEHRNDGNQQNRFPSQNEETERISRQPVAGAYHYTGPELNHNRSENQYTAYNNGPEPRPRYGGSRTDKSGEPQPGFFQRKKGQAGTQPNGSFYQPYPNDGKRAKGAGKKSGFGAGSVVAIALAAALLGGGIGGGVAAAINGSSGGTAQVAVSDRAENSGGSEVTTTKVKAGDTMTSSQIYSTYGKSVVSVNIKTSQGEGAGTGFFISKEGYILTCHHVINGATAISVVTQDSTSYEAEVVGSDSDLDTAVLKIKNPGDTTFPAVVLGDSTTLTVGDNVTAIGNALGTLANTLTTGVVSAKDRAISMSDGTAMNLLQTDCTVNSGNSGGPLFNQYGEVIGIVNAKYSSSGGSMFNSNEASIEGIGFAIPINDVQDILSDLMEHGYVTGKPQLGITVSTVSSVTAQQYSNMVVGAYVNSVTEGSCAAKAGLQVGDIVTQVDGKDITTSAELIDAKNSHKAGDEMTLTVYRDNDYTTLKVTLDEQQPDAKTDPDTQTDNQQGQGGQSQGGQGQNGQSYYSWPYGWH